MSEGFDSYRFGLCIGLAVKRCLCGIDFLACLCAGSSCGLYGYFCGLNRLGVRFVVCAHELDCAGLVVLSPSPGRSVPAVTLCFDSYCF